MQIWAKEYLGSKIIREMTVECCTPELSRTKKTFRLLEEICHKWDLAVPVWFESTIHDFKYHAKARFQKDNFIESIDFDYLEIQVIEE